MQTLSEQLELTDPRPDGVKPHPGRRMSEGEFVAWYGEKSRAEWVEGEIIMTAPASTGHDELRGWLSSVIGLYVEHHDLGRLHGPELLVRFTAPRHQRRLPDLLFVAKDRIDILRQNHVEGPPDLIVEIISPDSAERDWQEKYRDYEAAGVREYWVIDRPAKRVEAFVLEAKKFTPVPQTQDALASRVLPGFYLRPSWLWQEPLPRAMDVLRGLRVVG